jgi:hypothetical protein
MGDLMARDPLSFLNALLTHRVSSRSEEWYDYTSRNILDVAATLLPRIIQYLHEDTAALAAVASESYFHANGFAKIVLASSADTLEKIRVHVWSAGYSSEPSDSGDAHDHRWPFSSVPLMGSFREARFIETASGADKYLYRCRPRSGEQRLRLSGPQEAAIEKVSDSFHLPGNSYYCTIGEVHQFSPSCPTLAATIIVTGTPERNSAKVYSDRSLTSSDLSIPSPTMTTEQLRSVLSKLTASYSAL